MPREMHKGPIYRKMFTQNYLKLCMSSGESDRCGKAESWSVSEKIWDQRHNGRYAADVFICHDRDGRLLADGPTITCSNFSSFFCWLFADGLLPRGVDDRHGSMVPVMTTKNLHFLPVFVIFHHLNAQRTPLDIYLK